MQRRWTHIALHIKCWLQCINKYSRHRKTDSTDAKGCMLRLPQNKKYCMGIDPDVLFQRPYSPQLQHDVGLCPSPFGSTTSLTSAYFIIIRCIMCLNFWTTTQKTDSNLSCIFQNLQSRDTPPATRWPTYCSHLRGAVT